MMQVDQKWTLDHQQILLYENVLAKAFFEYEGLVEDLHGKVFLETLMSHMIDSSKLSFAQNSMKNVLTKIVFVFHAF